MAGFFDLMFSNANDNNTVQTAKSNWNLFFDTLSNPLSQSTQSYVSGSNLISTNLKQYYSKIVSSANSLTGGLASSNVLTKGIRYSKTINAGIDTGIAVSSKVAPKLKQAETKVNSKIDDAVSNEKAKLAEKKKERELPVLKEQDDNTDEWTYSRRKSYV